MPDARLDVLEVEIATGKVRVMATNRDEQNAEAFIYLAVARRGVEHHFYTTAPSGKYHDGDTHA